MAMTSGSDDVSQIPLHIITEPTVVHVIVTFTRKGPKENRYIKCNWQEEKNVICFLLVYFY